MFSTKREEMWIALALALPARSQPGFCFGFSWETNIKFNNMDYLYIARKKGNAIIILCYDLQGSEKDII